MKKITNYFSLLLLCLVVRAQAQNVFTSLDSALIACYPFSGNANDQSGNNLNGTVNGATLVADRFGNPNSAYSFAGAPTTQNIVLPGFSSQLNGNGVSICFWTSKSTVVYDLAFVMSPDNVSNRLGISPYYPGPYIYWDYGDIAGTGRLSSTNAAFPVPNAWDHWVYCATNTSMKVYKNGVLVASKNSASTFSTTPLRDLCIGGAVNAGGGLSWYNGKLDDIRIYRRGLLASEVLFLYTNNINCAPCPAVSIPTSSNTNQSLCAGNSVTVSASGTSTLQWYSSFSSTASINSGTGLQTPLNASGNYTYYVRSSNGCNSSSPLAITCSVTALPNVQITASTPSLCPGQTSQLLGTGATSYTWLPVNLQSSSLSVSPLSTTTYMLRGLMNGCANETVIAISIVNQPTVLTAPGSPSVCFGSSATLSASGAASYTWEPGMLSSQTISVTPATSTIYTVTGSANGCTGTSTLFMNVVNLPVVHFPNINSQVCIGKTASLSASGAVSYTWEPGTFTSPNISVTPTATAIYTVTGSANGCTSTSTLLLNVIPLPTVSISGSSLICLGKTALLLASGASNYTWTPGNVQSQILSISPTSNTNYTVTGETSGCSNTATISMLVVNPPTLSVLPANPTVCPGAQVSFTASGATSYNWNTGNTTPVLAQTLLSGLSFTVTGTDANNCSSTATVSASVYTVSPMGISSSASLTCKGDSLTLIAYGASSYTWANGSLSSYLLLAPLNTSTYTVYGVDLASGCVSSASLTHSVTDCTSLFEIYSADKTFFVYPNPNTGRFTFRAELPCEAVITNALGELVYKARQQGSSEISLEHLSSGIYLMTVYSAQKTVSFKLIKE